VKIFIAGGAGYVGSVLAGYLTPVDQVTIFDRMLYGVPVIRDGQGADANLPTITGDIRGIQPEALEGQDVVINLAGFSNDPTAEFSPAANDTLNRQAAVDLMRAAAKAGVKRYVFASSASVYDRCAEQNMAFEDSVLIEQAAMYPYSRAKIQAEGELAAVAMETGMSLVILRKGTVYGWSPRMRYDLVANAMVGTAIQYGWVQAHVSPQGPMYRPIVDLRDVATAYQRACVLKVPDGWSETFNIASDNLSIIEIAANVVAASTCRLDEPARLLLVDIPADRNIRSYRMSTDRAQSVLGWTPEWPLAKALEDLFFNVWTFPEEIGSPRAINIKWMEHIIAVERAYERSGPILGASS
jgi:nucleoside-diphosphate-sugar epimerase